jgi:hypothetical protein
MEAGELYTRENESGIFWLLLIMQVTYPMHGFGNLLAYARPRYVHCRRRSPEQTIMWCLHHSLFDDDCETRRSRRCSSVPRRPVESFIVGRTPATEIQSEKCDVDSSILSTSNYAAAIEFDYDAVRQGENICTDDSFALMEFSVGENIPSPAERP